MRREFIGIGVLSAFVGSLAADPVFAVVITLCAGAALYAGTKYAPQE